MAGRDDVDHQPLNDMDLVIRADRRVCYLSLSKLENSAFDYSSIGHCGRAERLDLQRSSQASCVPFAPYS